MIKKMLRPFSQWFLVLTLLPGLGFAAPPQSQSPQGGALETVDINTATAQQMADTLQGIGLKRAEAIIAYRDRFGKFYSAEALTAVKGIGANTIKRNLSRIKVSSAE